MLNKIKQITNKTWDSDKIKFLFFLENADLLQEDRKQFTSLQKKIENYVEYYFKYCSWIVFTSAIYYIYFITQSVLMHCVFLISACMLVLHLFFIIYCNIIIIILSNKYVSQYYYRLSKKMQVIAAIILLLIVVGLYCVILVGYAHLLLSFCNYFKK